ncbi:copper homeostasis protein CutC [Albidovulum sediminicola]|uniref:PF03932 family protein CutC n=1 Tax=Albidovulum sediminicola TaxID=2984331 RepID=A0ABT2YWD1_9RHOB|nr:copper homeostasis protein CutC [Defluviimonas sp. WL0075]MCV2863188.1 copper homeostasis protein CutC [Defluviimonas sp. WL0075]
MRLEVCVDSDEGMRAAVEGGADRIELCAALALGGLTPSAGQMARAADLPIPVHALIRARPGDFRFAAGDVEAMLADVRWARQAGLAGVVLGAALPDGRLDRAVLSRLREAAGTMSATLNRVFDLVPDREEAVETAVAMGFDRILSSGGAVLASEGTLALAATCRAAAGRIAVLPGAGISEQTVGALLECLPVEEVHSSCALPVPLDPRAAALGFGPPEPRHTSAERVRALKAAMARAQAARDARQGLR